MAGGPSYIILSDSDSDSDDEYVSRGPFEIGYEWFDYGCVYGNQDESTNFEPSEVHGVEL